MQRAALVGGLSLDSASAGARGSAWRSRPDVRQRAILPCAWRHLVACVGDEPCLLSQPRSLIRSASSSRTTTPILRSGLRLLLGAEPDLEVVGEANNGIEAVEQTTGCGRTWW